MKSLTLHIEGMSCGHCLNAVNRSLTGLHGVTVKGVQIGRATIDYEPAEVGVPAIVQAVEDAGYRATPSAE